MKVNVNFDLDVDPEVWAAASGDDPDQVTTKQVATEVAIHAESVIRDLFHDMGWTIGDHHPQGHPQRDECTFCNPSEKRAV